MPDRPYLTRRLEGFGASIFAEITALARQHDAINLGQGAPDFDGPEWIREAAVEAIRAGHNQYAPTPGIPELRGAIVRHQERFYGLRYDPDQEITVYAGATEALFSTLQALCDPGDEVIAFEPFYDSYPAALALAGAKLVPVTLHEPGFRYDPAELEAAIGPRTRAILLNTPHNPSGTVFNRDELIHIAGLCQRHDLLAISDEVYEHLVFEGEHLCLASLPGMASRTIVVSSGGKTFSATGWKIGWTCAPAEITSALRTVHQFVTFSNGTPFQHAIAKALDADDSFYSQFLDEYRLRRDRMCAGLEAAGFGVVVPAGTYFVLGDIRPLGEIDGEIFARDLPRRVGVAAIPTGSFYDSSDEGRSYIRFGFCKRLESIDEGVTRLLRLAS